MYEAQTAKKRKEDTVLDDTYAALDSLKTSLKGIQVSKPEAMKLERKLKGESFESWFEKSEVMKVGPIPIEKIDSFLEQIQKANEGITNDKVEEMRNICTNKSKESFVDWTFKKPDNSGARYGIVAFGKYPDEKQVDCLQVLFKMDFPIVPKEKHTTKSFISTLSTKFSHPKDEASEKDDPLTEINGKDFQNLFRLKVLEECYREGYIEQICQHVNPLEGTEQMEGITIMSDSKSKKTSEEDCPNSLKK